MSLKRVVGLQLRGPFREADEAEGEHSKAVNLPVILRREALSISIHLS